MTPEAQQSESPYAVKIETAAGKSTTVPIAVLTAKELEVFLQVDFKKLAQEAGVRVLAFMWSVPWRLIMSRLSVRLQRGWALPRQGWHD